MTPPRKAKGRPSPRRIVTENSSESNVPLVSGTDQESIPSSVRATLPGDTAVTWLVIAPLMPTSAYLIGGTALTVQLQHRVSCDLLFFLEQEEDLDALWAAFRSAGNVVASERSEGTLNCLFNETKVQVLDASTQRLVRTTTRVAGIRVASVEDIMAAKIKVIIDRGELRDYFDLMRIEQQVGLQAESGIALAVQKYDPQDKATFVFTFLKALGSFSDVADDLSLSVGRQVIEEYWTKRQLQLAKRFDSFGGA